MYLFYQNLFLNSNVLYSDERMRVDSTLRLVLVEEK